MFRILSIRRQIQYLLTAALVGGALVLLPATGLAATVNPLDTDINADGLGFGLSDAFAFDAGFGQDDIATFHGNDIIVQTKFGTNGGAGLSIPLSNGENGYTETFDTLILPNDTSNPDVNNATAPHSLWAGIGNVIPPANPTPPSPVTGAPNPRVGLNNGNVIRYSMWVREDPNNNFVGAPQIEPVFKFEFWKEGLSTFQDTAGGLQPTFADKVFDTDQHGGAGIWIDLDGNGSVIDAAAAGEGRIRTITDTAWTLIEVEYAVDDSAWFGIDDDVYTVADIEEIRSVMFWGEFAGGAASGSLWIDNALVEVFANQATADANPITTGAGGTNPDPIFSEVPTADFDNDGDVDGDDFLAWQRGNGILSGAATTQGDANFDGAVNATDLGFWQTQYATPLTAAVTNVPEPSSAMLVLIGLVCLKRRRQIR